MTDTDNESTAFPEIKPIDAGPELGRFMTAMRSLHGRSEVHQAPQGVAPAGRGPHLPGLGHPLMPPWMHVDYRKITPIDEPLRSHGRIDSIDGRKAFVTATMTDSDGNVLSEASGLMIRLLPHQP